MCLLIYTKRATVNENHKPESVRPMRFQRQAPRRAQPNAYESDILAPAPNTVSYGAPPERTLLGSNIVGATESAWVNIFLLCIVA